MHGESWGTGVFQMFSIRGWWDPRMEYLHIEGTDEQLLSERLGSDINEGDGSLSVSLTVNYDSTRPGNPDFQCLDGSCVCVENHVCPLPHAISCFLRVSSPMMILSFLRSPFLLPLCLSYELIPQCFSNFCWLHCNKKYTVIRNITHANIGTCLSTDLSINMCQANTNFIGYILMSSVISQLSPWPTNRLDVAHHPPSNFFETVYFISITCMCGEDECMHMTECRYLEATDPWSWVTGGCELPAVGAGNRNKSSKWANHWASPASDLSFYIPAFPRSSLG